MTQSMRLTVLYRGLDAQMSEFNETHRYRNSIELCVNIVKDILAATFVRDSLVELAVQIDHHQTEPWYGKLNADIERAKQLADSFLGTLDRDFPLLIIDEQLSNADRLAYHLGTDWFGTFEPGKQVTYLNASRVEHMCRAAIENEPDFRVLQFTFTVALLLQVGHLFVTFLLMGHPISPAGVPSNGRRLSEEYYNGWNCRWERRLLGGCVQVYRDPDMGAWQPGVPHIVKSDNRGDRIPRAAIEALVVHKNYSLPIITDPQPTLDPALTQLM